MLLCIGLVLFLTFSRILNNLLRGLLGSQRPVF